MATASSRRSLRVLRRPVESLARDFAERRRPLVDTPAAEARGAHRGARHRACASVVTAPARPRQTSRQDPLGSHSPHRTSARVRPAPWPGRPDRHAVEPRPSATAAGLGCCDRRAASHAKRARLTATRTIRAATASLARVGPSLGWHVSLAFRTGWYCSAPRTRVPRSPRSADPRPISTWPERRCTPIERHPGVSRTQQIAAYRTTGPAVGTRDMLAGDRSGTAGGTMPESSATRGTAYQAHCAGPFAQYLAGDR